MRYSVLAFRFLAPGLWLSPKAFWNQPQRPLTRPLLLQCIFRSFAFAPPRPTLDAAIHVELLILSMFLCLCDLRVA
ncbi:hypothetical protein VTN96DRAFT_2580 [Rasamsonia emersonii]